MWMMGAVHISRIVSRIRKTKTGRTRPAHRTTYKRVLHCHRIFFFFFGIPQTLPSIFSCLHTFGSIGGGTLLYSHLCPSSSSSATFCTCMCVFAVSTAVKPCSKSPANEVKFLENISLKCEREKKIRPSREQRTIYSVWRVCVSECSRVCVYFVG